LNINGCHDVTNAGIKFLCVDYIDGKENKAMMKSLENLMINNTGVTKRGAQMALKCLPALKYLYHETTFEILVNLATTSSKYCYRKPAKIPKLSLRYLLIQKISPHGNHGLGLIVSVCPLLTCIVIDRMDSLTDEDLLSLILLKNLRELRICNYPLKERQVRITFDGGIAPLLKEVGSSMIKLYIMFFDVGNIWKIVELCPNLIYLALIDRGDRGRNHIPLPEIGSNFFPVISEYSSLQKLEIYYGYYLTSEILFFLLSFPLLKIISVNICNALTDDILQKLVNCHRLQNLEELMLKYCDSVTKKGVDALMTHHNPLKSICISCCENLTPDDIADWEQQAHQKNWNIKFRYSGP
jgi:hypothetical protein